MAERLAGDADAETPAIGEVRQGLPAGRMFLPGDQLALKAFGRPPVCGAASHRAQQPIGIATGMQALRLLQQRRRPQAWHLLQQRHQLRLPDIGNRIRARAVAPHTITLTRLHRVLVDPPRCALAEPGARSGSRLTISVPARLHIPPDLLIGDMLPRHRLPNLPWRARAGWASSPQIDHRRCRQVGTLIVVTHARQRGRSWAR
jgi:hypothetical protein